LVKDWKIGFPGWFNKVNVDNRAIATYILRPLQKMVVLPKNCQARHLLPEKVITGDVIYRKISRSSGFRGEKID
jgi:hypothetical protein